MFINEDYFNDIEINDEDITADDNNINDKKYNDAKALDNYLTSKYKQCIIIKLDTLSSCYDFEGIDNRYISPIIKRLQYIFNVYDIEYEYILRDETNPDDFKYNNNAYIYDLGKHKVFSFYDMEEYYESVCVELNIVLYLNIPDFNYKDSYKFIDRIRYAVWKNDYVSYDVIQKIYFTEKTLSLFECFSYGLLQLSNDFCINPYQDCGVIVQGLPYRRFFKKAICFFNHTDEDKQAIERMWKQIVVQETDPFKCIRKTL